MRQGTSGGIYLRPLLGWVMAAGLSATSMSAVAQDISGQIEYGYWGNAARAEVTEAVSRLFEAKYPGTTVTGVSAEYVAYIERLTVQAAASELPCVTQVQTTFLATYARRGALLPLDELIASGAIDVSGIPASVLETGKIEGKQYFIPTGVFLRLLAINKTMAEANGIPILASPATYEQYEAWLRDAQTKLPSGVFAAENEAVNMFTLYSWVTGHGEELFDGQNLAVSQETLTSFFAFWDKLAKDGVAIPPDRIDELVGSIELTPMSTGTALTGTKDIPHAALIEGVLGQSGTPSEVVMVSNPENPDAHGNVPGGNGLAISANCNNVPVAAAYINYFSNDPEAAVAFRSSNGVAISSTGRQALLDNPDTPANVRRSLSVLDSFAASGDIAAASYPAGYQALPPLLRRVYEDIAFNGVTPEDAAKTFASEAATLLQ
jgi:multiple sugar transport system substrate-binding protein